MRTSAKRMMACVPVAVAMCGHLSMNNGTATAFKLTRRSNTPPAPYHISFPRFDKGTMAWEEVTIQNVSPKVLYDLART